MNLLDTGHYIRAEIIGFSGDSRVLERLHEMGLHKGVEVQLTSRTPFSGPIIIQAGTGFLALRQEEAQCIQVRPIEM